MAINQAPAALIRKLKDNDENWEYYPSTPDIINKIKQHIGGHDTVLDCGAGNGSTLFFLTTGKKYAIEKSQILVSEMDPEIFVVGCDFWENSLIDKKVDVVFCNPPYSQYKEWAIKIINEANAGQIFLVIPERWKDQPAIMAAIEDRKAHHSVIGSFDFLEADRPARAKVDIIKINLRKKAYYSQSTVPDVDPFTLWVSKEFPLNERNEDDADKQNFKQRINELVPGNGLIPALVELYGAEMMTLQENFRVISQLDISIFAELKIDFKSMTEFLRGRIKGLKEKYWRELFSNLEVITSRLTVDSRKKLLATLTENISVDFTESNIHAVTIWAIKNANSYFDSQLIEAFEGLVNKANLVNYVSNQKTWGNDQWRFREELRDGKITNYGLDYRCVLSVHGTFDTRGYQSYDYPNGLNKSVHNRLNDLITIANNLGFTCPDDSMQKQWTPGSTTDFRMTDGTTLMSVKAYKNGNLHVKFNQTFLRKLNVEFGRLKGWLRSPAHASQELNIPEEEARRYFKANFSLECSDNKLLGFYPVTDYGGLCK